MALTRRGLLFGVGDARVYEMPEATKGDGIGYAAPRTRAQAQVPGGAGSGALWMKISCPVRKAAGTLMQERGISTALRA